MGGYHDFIEFAGLPIRFPRYDSNGNTCTGIGGIMGYDLFVDHWTQCSIEDFEWYFR